MSQALTPIQQKQQGLTNYLTAQTAFLESLVSSTIDPAELIRWTALVWRGNEKLQQCSSESILLALVAIGQWGLKPNPYTGEAYIVPFGKIATAMPGYRGLIKLARRAGIHPRAAVVYDGDQIEILKGSTERVTHVVELDDAKRGDALGAYAVAEVAGEVEVCWMSKDEIFKVRDAAPGDSDAWRDWPEEMARKTVLRRLCKTLPLGDDYFQAAEVDNKLAVGDVLGARAVIDVEVPPEFATPPEAGDDDPDFEAEVLAEFDRLGGLIEEAKTPADFAKLIAPIDNMREPERTHLQTRYMNFKTAMQETR